MSDKKNSIKSLFKVRVHSIICTLLVRYPYKINAYIKYYFSEDKTEFSYQYCDQEFETYHIKWHHDKKTNKVNTGVENIMIDLL